MQKPGQLSLSFLDLLCSAMGGMVVLAVIFSVIKNPILVPQVGEFILIELEVDKRREIGFLIESPADRTLAVLPNQPETDIAPFSDASEGIRCWQGRNENNGTLTLQRVFLEVRTPIRGTWVFRPFVVDWDQNLNGTSNQAGSTQFKVIGIWTGQGPGKLPENKATSAIAPTYTTSEPIVITVL